MGVSGNSGRAAIRWGDVVLASIAAVSWALVAMAGTAALGLHLLGADAAGALGPMTAAVVVLGAGGSVTPTGDVSAFGLSGAQADTAVDFAPLGVALAGALLLAWFFLRSLRAAGSWIPAYRAGGARGGGGRPVRRRHRRARLGRSRPHHDRRRPTRPGRGEGAGRARASPASGTSAACCRAGSPTWRTPGRGSASASMPPVRWSGAACWVAGVLVIALLASRRTPLPRGWEALHRVVRPAVSALVAVVLVAVAAGFAAAAYAAVGDAHPRRIAGAALLGAPNGVWLAIPLGLFVPWNGRATGALTTRAPRPARQTARRRGRPGGDAGAAGSTRRPGMAVGRRHGRADAVRGSARRGAYAGVRALPRRVRGKVRAGARPRAPRWPCR